MIIKRKIQNKKIQLWPFDDYQWAKTVEADLTLRLVCGCERTRVCFRFFRGWNMIKTAATPSTNAIRYSIPIRPIFSLRLLANLLANVLETLLLYMCIYTIYMSFSIVWWISTYESNNVAIAIAVVVVTPSSSFLLI